MSGQQGRFEPAPFELPPEVITPGQLYVLMQSLNTKMSLVLIDNKALKQELNDLKEETKEMRQAWATAGNLLRFVKYLAQIGAAVGVVWVLFKGLGEGIKAWFSS